MCQTAYMYVWRSPAYELYATTMTITWIHDLKYRKKPYKSYPSLKENSIRAATINHLE